MKEKNELDRRIQRTRQMLSTALFALIVEKGYEAITVQDITERANIGRATFYLHYHDKEQLLENSLTHLINDFIKHVDLTPNTSTTYQTLSIRVFEHIAERHELYRALLQGDGPPSIVVKMHRSLSLLIQQRVLQLLVARSKEGVDLELLAIHAAGSLLALIIWWLDHNLTPVAEEMGDLFWRLIAPGINDVLDLENR